jgi:putative ABC transport system ATP-binding protein
LSKCYQEGSHQRPVLVDASADFDKGESIAILGRSGSGKSTLLNLISGIDLADAGQICVDGVELTALDEQQRTLYRRRNIGFIYQFFNLIPTLTTLENVTLPLELNGVPLHTARRRAAEMLDSVGLLERTQAFPDRLSGGEQQEGGDRLRALVHDPCFYWRMSQPATWTGRPVRASRFARPAGAIREEPDPGHAQPGGSRGRPDLLPAEAS